MQGGKDPSFRGDLRFRGDDHRSPDLTQGQDPFFTPSATTTYPTEHDKANTDA